MVSSAPSSWVCMTTLTTASWSRTSFRWCRFTPPKMSHIAKSDTTFRYICAATRIARSGKLSCLLAARAEESTFIRASNVAQSKSQSLGSTGRSVSSSSKPEPFRCSSIRRIASSTLASPRFAVKASWTCNERQRLCAYRDSILRSLGATRIASLYPSDDSLYRRSDVRKRLSRPAT
eukprot:scaffold1896_cov262-Pinguiococcus_pyrenoidosus.AAC.1